MTNPINHEFKAMGGPVHDHLAVSELLYLHNREEGVFDAPPDAKLGFLTFFDPGWNLLRQRTFCKDKGRIFYNQGWYDREAFAKTTEEPRYRQIRLEAVDGSFNKDFESQRRLLPETEEIPLVRAVTMGMVIHFLRSGQRLFERSYVRCADKGSDGGRVYVGDFDADGLYVCGYWDGSRNDCLGLASARKS